MKYILYYRTRLAEPQASDEAMEQQRDGAELIKSKGNEIEGEYIEDERAPAGKPEMNPRPKLRKAFEQVARLRKEGCKAQLAIMRIGPIGTGDPFEWFDESERSEENWIILYEHLDARGEAGELLRQYRGVIDPDYGIEYFLHEAALDDFYRRKGMTGFGDDREDKTGSADDLDDV